jgi:hypothetical protein
MRWRLDMAILEKMDKVLHQDLIGNSNNPLCILKHLCYNCQSTIHR